MKNGFKKWLPKTVNLAFESMSKDFKVEAYAGGDIERMIENNERPPRSAKLVAEIDFGSGPGGGDYRTYFLCTDRKRSGWYLWMMLSDYDTGKPVYDNVAFGRPYRGISPKHAAEELLTKLLKDELDIWGMSSEPWSVDEPGLLDADDIKSIELTVCD